MRRALRQGVPYGGRLYSYPDSYLGWKPLTTLAVRRLAAEEYSSYDLSITSAEGNISYGQSNKGSQTFYLSTFCHLRVEASQVGFPLDVRVTRARPLTRLVERLD